ncbi:hypothetical protein [Helicobacter bilis]|uniref:hypothetical protein n=1 Tax=Helicobacter bilis TaxID=37372 RepID=UPI000CF0794E|nr:hypothetical protein [Helicobacter bilis]
MLWSITVIFAILAGLIVFFVVLALLIAALGAGTAVAILVLPFLAFVKGLEQAYYWYAGEPFQILWVICGVISVPIIIVIIVGIKNN